MDPNIFGTRLKLARKMAGMSLQQLSDALEGKVTKQSINKYEQGMMKPSTDVLMILSKELSVKPDYFLKKGVLGIGEISFRKKASLNIREEEAIIEKARDYVERYLELENILGNMNEFKNPLIDIKISNDSDIENAAIQLRKEWELGNNPIYNLVEMLEMQGIKVFLIEEDDAFDGFAAFSSNGIPIVVVNTRERSIERIRFTIIHELAHILLVFEKRETLSEKELENYCHYFSSNFLLPKNMIIKLIGGNSRKYIAISELINIKEYYGISIRALVHRLMKSKIISENYYKRWMIYMNKTYGKKGEPGNYNGIEQNKAFEQLLSRALSEGLISLSKAASLSNKSLPEIRKFYNRVN